MGKKKKEYQPETWEPSGFCSKCFMGIEARMRGTEVRHHDGTKYCLSSMQKANRPADERTTAAAAPSVQQLVESPEAEDEF